jgi:hypothetical protein
MNQIVIDGYNAKCLADITGYEWLVQGIEMKLIDTFIHQISTNVGRYNNRQYILDAVSFRHGKFMIQTGGNTGTASGSE